MAQTRFAYHLTHHFGSFELNSYHTNHEAPKSDDIIYVVSGDVVESPPNVDYSLEGKFRIARKDAGPFRLKDRKGGQQDFQYRLSMKPIQVPDAPIKLSTADWYRRQDMHRYFSSGQNFNPLPSEPEYKRLFDELLAGFGQSATDKLRQALIELETTVPDVTERQVLAKARIGQGEYRI